MTNLEKYATGRPETLTKEEEVKLKEFWSACLKVFGVAEETGGEAAAEPKPTAEETSTEEAKEVESVATGGEKKKKSLGRLLSRREKKTDAKPPPTNTGATEHTAAVTALADVPEDKYGSTKEFKAALASQTPAELREAFWAMTKCDNPDGLLLRFLRARKWDVDKALVMMVATMNWRSKEADVAGVIKRGEGGAVAEEDEGFMKQLRMGKSFLHGRDKEGRPICYVRVRLHKQADQSEQSLERYTIYIIETARLMLRDHVDTAAVVFDMTNFSLANMDYAPVKFMIKCFEAHYPESLGICFVHKAPWVFQGVWSIIKGWLDPVVASKIHFTKTSEELEQFIERSHIIKELGGDEDWEYSYIEPVAGEDDELKNTTRLASLQTDRDSIVLQYEDYTRAWIATDGEASDKAREKRTQLMEQMKKSYWEMDRHLRGRTIYDRTGVIKKDGSLDFYPAKKAEPAPIETSSDDID
ncbi:CRAL-TRIO domain-containing protein [Geopyxis carbonaria]|nr:CRAL-TRIO domain-containing protein [Geopyxis carbonaria]